MKKLLFLLLFIPLVSFSQSQEVNGISLNGPNGFVKVGDLTWEKEDEGARVVVAPLEMIFSKTDKEALLKKEAKGVKFLFSQKVNILPQSGPIEVAVMKSPTNENKTVFIAKCLEEKDGYTYMIMPSSICIGNEAEIPPGSDRTLGEASITQLFDIIGYMVERIRDHNNIEYNPNHQKEAVSAFNKDGTYNIDLFPAGRSRDMAISLNKHTASLLAEQNKDKDGMYNLETFKIKQTRDYAANLNKEREEEIQREKKLDKDFETAVSKLKNLKELLDLGIITQEEYDKTSLPLIKIIRENIN